MIRQQMQVITQTEDLFQFFRFRHDQFLSC